MLARPHAAPARRAGPPHPSVPMSVRNVLSAGALGVACFCAFLPAALGGQAVEPRAPVERTELGGRLHLQWNTTSADGAHASEFLMRRARIWAATRVNDWIDGAVQVDVSGATAVARYAFVRMSFSPQARVSFGQFKRAFDLFELTSSADVLVVERDGNLRGAADCAGVGGICSFTRFSEKLQLSALDVGVLLQGATPDGRLGWLFSVTNGAGMNAREENGAKSFSGRLEWAARERVKLSANAGFHDFTNDVTGHDEHAPALGADVEVGDFDRGLHVQAGIMAGDNWLNLDEEGTSSRFVTWQAIATWKIPVEGKGRIGAVEPIARVSWGDPDRGAASDGGLLLTPGFVLHFKGKNKFGVNLDAWRPQSGDAVWGLKAQTYLYF